MQHWARQEGTEADSDMPLLAKPSVRWRKTINTIEVREGKEYMRAVNAQHYAVLVTDVDQWPYPELQQCVPHCPRCHVTTLTVVVPHTD
jgi:hypothetical protein